MVIETALSSYHRLILKNYLSRVLATDQLFYGRGVPNHVVICSKIHRLLMAEPRQQAPLFSSFSMTCRLHVVDFDSCSEEQENRNI